MGYAEHGNDEQYYDWNINDSPRDRWYYKIVGVLTYVLGMNIQIGILMKRGDGKVESRITLGRRGHLYRAVRFSENTS